MRGMRTWHVLVSKICWEVGMPFPGIDPARIKEAVVVLNFLDTIVGTLIFVAVDIYPSLNINVECFLPRYVSSDHIHLNLQAYNERKNSFPQDVQNLHIHPLPSVKGHQIDFYFRKYKKEL